MIGRIILIASVLLLSLASWVILWFESDSIHRFVHFSSSDHQDESFVLFMLLFAAGWTVMTIAMMLPTSLPLINTFYAVVRHRKDRSLLLILVILGYLVIWTLFGIFVFTGIVILRCFMDSHFCFKAQGLNGAPFLLILAGAFQFTSLKYRCLDKCRFPLTFVIEHWQGRNNWQNALRLGIDHGIFCVGCCWALMLLMFAVAAGHMAWMFLLGSLMAIEKNMSWGRRFSPLLGWILLGWGMALLIA